MASQEDDDEPKTSLSEKTPISFLQEICVRVHIAPKYELFQIEGAVHTPTFHFKVTVGDKTAVGSGPNKQMAKHRAAAAMIEVLKSINFSILTPSGDTDLEVLEEIPRLENLSISTPGQNQIPGNPIGELRTLLLDLGKDDPVYKTTKEEGPSHDRYFEIVCTVNNKLCQTGTGKNKKQAKREAAHKVLTIVKSMAPEALEQTYKDEDAVNDVDDFRNAESEHYKMLFETSPEELLNKIVESKKLVTNFVSAEMKSMSGKVLCFVEIRATNSLLVFTGSGDSAETARAETCRNAIEYFRVVFDI